MKTMMKISKQMWTRKRVHIVVMDGIQTRIHGGEINVRQKKQSVCYARRLDISKSCAKPKKAGSIKAIGVQTSTSTSKLTIDVKGPGMLVPIEVEADTGANICVAKADILQKLTWI